MSMLFLSRRFYGIFFLTSPLSSRVPLLSARTLASTTLGETLEKPNYVTVSELLNERDLREMVDKFKLFCFNQRYRNQYKKYMEIVRRLAAAKHFSWIEEIFEDQKKYCVANVGFVTRIIDMYGQAGMFDHARKMFDEMPLLDCNRSVSTFNSLLEACIRSKKYDEIGRIFSELPPKLSITPNMDSYNILVKAYTKMGCVDDSLLTVKEMVMNDVMPNSMTYSFILDGLYQSARIEEASMVWESLKSKGVFPCIRCYTSKLRHLVAERNMTEAVKLFEELGSNRIVPDSHAFCVLFEGFRNERNFDETKKFYRRMKHYNCCPNEFIYEILVPFATGMCDFEFAYMLCLEAIKAGCLLAPATLQGVVDGLADQDKVDELKQLLKWQNNF